MSAVRRAELAASLKAPAYAHHHRYRRLEESNRTCASSRRMMFVRSGPVYWLVLRLPSIFL